MLCWFVLLGSKFQRQRLLVRAACLTRLRYLTCEDHGPSWTRTLVLIFPRNDVQDDPVATFFFRILSRIRWVAENTFAPHLVQLSNWSGHLSTAKKAIKPPGICQQRQVLHVHLWKRARLAWKRWIAFCCCSLLLVHPYAVIQRTLVASKDKSFVAWSKVPLVPRGRGQSWTWY